MKRISLVIVLVLSFVLLIGGGKAHAQEMPANGFGATLLASGLEGGSGSTVGPDGALYVVDNLAGNIVRVDPETGDVTPFVEGLPPSVIGIGGVMDVAFISDTAYALVTLVGEDVGASDVVGIYQIDGPDSFTVVADIGEFSAQNVPTNANIKVMAGVQYALQPYGDDLLVTDGHHNRVLEVTLDGEITELIAWGNVVPTGMALSGDTVYVAQAGPVPHMPEHGKVVAFEVGSDTASDVASGARLVVDVEYGPDGRLFALSQGDWAGAEEGTPAEPNTGKLVEVNADGGFNVIAEGLDRPTSLEFIGDTAYVVTIGGEVWTVALQETCTLGTLKGTYVIQGTGAVIQEGEILPFAEAGILTMDGEGNATGVVSQSINGEPVVRMGAFTATYTVASGCAYSVALEGVEVDLYATPSGETITYFAPGVSGTGYR